MLTATLLRLERDGLAHRTIYPQMPSKVEYRLTPVGATLRELVRTLIDWTEAHLEEVDRAGASYELRANAGPPEGISHAALRSGAPPT